MRSLSVLLLTMACLVPVVAPAQSPEPTGGERIRVPARTIWATRGRAALQQGAIRLQAPPVAARPAPGVAALTGTLTQVVIPISFSTEAALADSVALEQHLFGTGGSARYPVRQFFEEASGGQFTVTGRVTRPVTVSRSSAFYTGVRANGVADSIALLVQEALARADQDVNFATFVTEGDQEHRVAAVVFMTAGRSGSCLGDTDHVWPHRWSLTHMTGRPYTTNDRLPNGSPVVVDDYIIQGLRPCESGASGFSGNGIVIHETGHLLGLPDLYVTADPSGASRRPAGAWDVMAHGVYHTIESPTRLGAFSRFMLGWGTVLGLDAGGEADSVAVTLPSAASGALVHWTLRQDERVLLAESRTRTGSDAAALPGEGLLLWVLDPAQIADGLSANTVNTLTRTGVGIVQADGAGDLERPLTTGGNFGDAGDVFPGARGRTAFETGRWPPFVPTSVDSTASAAGFRDLRLAAGTATFTAWWPARDVAVCISTETTLCSATHRVTIGAVGPMANGEVITLPLHAAVRALQSESVWLPVENVRWRTTSDLTALGLTLDATRGVLTGRLTTADTALRALVYADFPTSEAGDTVTVAYQLALSVLQAPPSFSVAMLVDAALGETPVDAALVAYGDALGNTNGRLDVGDVVRMVQRGLVSPVALLALPPTVPAALR